MDTQQSLRLELENAGLTPAGAKWARMAGGRSNAVWKVGGNLVCKLFLERENPLFSNSAADEFHCLQVLRGRNIAPEPVSRYKSFAGDIVIYCHVEGELWQRGTAPVARMLGKLHRQPVPDRLNRGEQGWGEIASRGAGILSCLPSESAAKLRAIMPEEKPVQPGPVAFVHGDVVPANIIKTGDGLRLIDWQSPAVGDPVTDLFCFLSPAMHVAYGEGPLAPAAVTEFLEVYPDKDVINRYHALKPILHWRMAAYCEWRVGQGDVTYRSAKEAELAALKQVVD
ncbi:MAG: aminoglycoside phosphotransferase family protein [Rhodobacteraceae bacterium]|nr:aminoglycoside phosphotransferase family protein [Paracoccaceae bacterium]